MWNEYWGTNFTRWINSASLQEKLPGLGWNTTVPVSHTETQGCDTTRVGQTLKWIPSPTFLQNIFISLHHWNQASRNKMLGAPSDMFKAKGAASSRKLNVGNYAINTSAFSVVQVISWGYVQSKPGRWFLDIYLEKQVRQGYWTVPFLWCTFQMIIPCTATIKSQSAAAPCMGN